MFAASPDVVTACRSAWLQTLKWSAVVALYALIPLVTLPAPLPTAAAAAETCSPQEVDVPDPVAAVPEGADEVWGASGSASDASPETCVDWTRTVARDALVLVTAPASTSPPPTVVEAMLVDIAAPDTAALVLSGSVVIPIDAAPVPASVEAASGAKLLVPTPA